MKNKLIMPALVLVTSGLVLAGGLAAHAQTLPAGGQSKTASIVQAIADKFGLKTTDVQAVFDSNRATQQANMQADMQAKQKAVLDKDVAAGNITAAQEQLIIAKLAELQANRPDPSTFKDLTKDQMKAKMDAQKTELDAWAKANGIDTKYLLGGFGGFMGGPRGGFGGHRPMMDGQTAPTTPAPTSAQ